MSSDMKTCPCEFNEIECCKSDCTCRHPLKSGGCLFCCKYGSKKQKLERADEISEILRSAFGLY